MDYYRTIDDFSTTSKTLAFFQSIASAVPTYFPMFLFLVWIFGSASSYFVILKTTGKKRFFHSVTAMSFIMFIVALLLASMNTTEVTILNGYWVGFYILMTLFSWYGLTQYK